MKIRNVALIFMISTMFGALYAETTVVIKNEYEEPIVVNLDGNDIRLLKTGESDNLTYWPQQIKIRTEKSNTYHSGIQKEVEKVKNAAQQNPNLYATITILKTSGLFNFNYNTDIKQAPSRPVPQKPAFSQEQLEQMSHTKNVTPVLDWIKSNANKFPQAAEQLALIERAVFNNGKDPKNAFMIRINDEILGKLALVVGQRRRITPNQFLSDIPDVIAKIYGNMEIQQRAGKITFN